MCFRQVRKQQTAVTISCDTPVEAEMVRLVKFRGPTLLCSVNAANERLCSNVYQYNTELSLSDSWRGVRDIKAVW